MRRQNKLRKKKVPTNCPFCKGVLVLDYKESEILKKYITEKGKIVGKDRTGVCSKHQRKLAREIKRARHLAFLPFTVTIK